MSDYMNSVDAIELVKLRIKEDKISSFQAVKDYRTLTGNSLSYCVNTKLPQYFQQLILEQKG